MYSIKRIFAFFDFINFLVTRQEVEVSWNIVQLEGTMSTHERLMFTLSEAEELFHCGSVRNEVLWTTEILCMVCELCEIWYRSVS